MKKLLIVPILFAIALFGFYHNNIEGKKIYVQPAEMTAIEDTIILIEKNGADYQSKKETNVTKPKLFKVEIGADINTTRDNEIEIQATVKNLANPTECNFFWYEEGELIGMGLPLTKSFEKGEHILTLKARTTEGNESIDRVIVTAWDYHKVVHTYYNSLINSFDTQRLNVYDHKKRLVLRESSYAKYMVTFNEEGLEEEVRNEYHHHPEWSDIRRYTYREDGSMETIKTLNLNEELTYFEKYFYDEEGNFTNIASGRNEELALAEQQQNVELYEESSNIYYNPENYESSYDDKSKVIKNEQNQTTYEEYDYGYVKESNSYEYDDNQTLIKSKRVSSYQSGDKEISIVEYDQEGNPIRDERVYKQGEEVLCHYNRVSTYNSNRKRLTSENKVLDGDCSNTIGEDSFEIYSYDEEGELKSIKESHEKGSEESYTSYKVIQFYSNTLEGDEQ
jgi:hypothetical protein